MHADVTDRAEDRETITIPAEGAWTSSKNPSRRRGGGSSAIADRALLVPCARFLVRLPAALWLRTHLASLGPAQGGGLTSGGVAVAVALLPRMM